MVKSNQVSAFAKAHKYLKISKQQHQAWMLQQLHPENPAYNLSVALKLTGKLDFEALKKSYIASIEAIEVLRACFSMHQGELNQAIVEISDLFSIEQVWLQWGDSTDATLETENFIAARMGKPFDLGRAPLIKAFLLAITKEEHLLLLVAHQSIADHESLKHLLNNISEKYRLFSAGSTAPGNLAVPQYSEFVDYHSQRPIQDAYIEKLKFWKDNIRMADGFLDIPVAKTRPSVQSFKGAMGKYSLPNEVVENARKLSSDTNTALPTILLNAFQILLFRYTGNCDFSVGVPFPNRNTDQFHNLVGPAENLLPLVTDFRGNPSFLEALNRTQTSLDAAWNHQEVTFDSIVEHVNPRRDPSYNPIFQVGFRFQTVRLPAFGDLKIELIDCFNNRSIFDLFLHTIEDNGKLRINIEYNPELFPAESIDAFAGQYQTLLAGALASKEFPISLLEILPGSEKTKQLVDWNNTRHPHPVSRKIHELFEHQVSLHPDRIAVEYESRTLTYKELDQRANQMAHYLQQYGIAPNNLVAVCLKRSCEMMVALLGILKAGGGYIPMDPDYPKERLAYIAQHSGAPVLITQESLLSFVPESGAKVICIDSDWKDIESCPKEKFPDQATYQDIAYVIYTSGSTGKPKGVQIPHGAVANLLNSMARQQGMGRDDVLISVTTYSFDLSVPDLYLPLFAGGRTVFAKTEVAANGALLARLIKEKNVTFMDATPSTWMLLLDSGWEGSDKLTALCGGEAWPSKLAKELAPRVKSLWNMYGPTETTVWSTSFRIDPSKPEVLIGKPIDNTSVYILDQNLQLLPIGVPGELYIGGYGVSLGYLKRPELNAKSFLKNPFGKEGHLRIYKTGDAVRYRPDGNMEYLNRLDNQVKVRGLRIELGEIEAVIAKYRHVKQVVVVVREDNANDKRLVAYFVTDDHSKIKETALRSYLKQYLPSYMVPQHHVQLDQLPRTPNGKVDRKALPIPQVMENDIVDYKDPVYLVKQPVDEWLYKPVWKKVPLESRAELPQAAICLIFMDESGVGDELADRLRQREYEVITVRSADTYYKLGDNEYTLNPEQGAAGYSSLIHDLISNGRHPNRIAHLWMITSEETCRPGSSFFHRNLEHGYYSILHLVQALNEEGLTDPMQLLTVLNGSQKVHGEQAIYPEKACAYGPCMVMTREFSQFRSRFVDIDWPTAKTPRKKNPFSFFKKRNTARFAKHLEKELLLPSENEMIAYRHGQRFLKTFESFELPRSAVFAFKENGVYLVAGGLGKLGCRIAAFIRQQVKAKLILVDAIYLPPKKDWKTYLDKPDKYRGIARTIQMLTDQKLDGDDVLIYSADIADFDRMKEVIDDAQNHFGSINGVINAAGAETDDPIFLIDNDKSERCFASKVGGTLVLDKLLRKRPGLDFIALFSSIDVATAEAGKAMSVAANAFLNAYAENSSALNPVKTMCLNWGAWKFQEFQNKIERLAPEEPTAASLTPNQRFSNYISANGIDPREGVLLFEKCLGIPSGTLTISPIHLSKYISEIEKRSACTDQDELVEPRDDIEKKLAEFWKEIIGLRNIGIRQNFFDIGGHSLTAVRLFVKIKEEYDIQWPLSVIFEAPTIESCARRIRDEIKKHSDEPGAMNEHRYKFLVKMHGGPGNGEAPIFIAAGGFGNVLNLRHLAQQLGQVRPVYGIQAKGLHGGEEPHETYEETAADYLKEIRKLQPHGPYILSGFCSGGTIAYEMAQQLIAEGETVAHLVMLDTIATDWRETLTKKDKIAFHKKSLEKYGAKYPIVWIINRFAWEWKKARERLGLNSESTGPAVFRGKAIFDATLRAEDRYQPKPYSGKVTLFRPRLDQYVKLEGNRAINKKRDFVRWDNGWNPHIKQLDVQEIAAEPGDHDGFVLEPAVRELARRFKEILR